MDVTNRQWVERYADKLNQLHGDLGKLSPGERKHFRMLLQEYELGLRLKTMQEQLSQGELPLDKT